VPNAGETWFSAVVEGDVDEAVLSKIAEKVGVKLAAVFGRNGKHSIYQRLHAYNKAARFSPWIILLDLDQDASCAPNLVSLHMPRPSKFLSFRIAVRAVESWLLADRKAFAAFLGVRKDILPDSPDLLADPKGFVVDLARNSRKKQFRREMVPRTGSRKRVGPAYTSRMMEFSLYYWDPVRAEALSESLKGCRTGIMELAKKINDN
jgi:hypothetical protein